MSLLYLTGEEETNSELALLLADNLASMGSAITQDQGTLAWSEAYAIALTQQASLDFIRLISNQLDPMTMSVYARRYAAIYNLPATGNNAIPDNLAQLQVAIGLKNALFGTPNTFTNVYQYIKGVLGEIFIDLESIHEIQNLAFGNAPPRKPTNFWFSPLSILLVREWQPRDNQDNLLMPTNVYLQTVDLYKNFVQNWLPAYSAPRNMELLYVGNDGYGITSGDVNQFPTPTVPTTQYGSENTIFASVGNTYIQGNDGCNFIADFQGAILNGWQMPIEVVADDNKLYTYHVLAQAMSTNYVNIVEEIEVSITNRSYRLLGCQADSPYVSDNALLNI